MGMSEDGRRREREDPDPENRRISGRESINAVTFDAPKRLGSL